MSSAVVIGVARVSRDSHAQASALLDRLDGALPDVPDRSVLVIRRLELPATQSHAAAEAIDEARRRAVRPAYGAADPDTGAVLFTDEAELLACLASDALAGRLGDRWYWRHIGPVRAPAAPAVTLAEAFLRRPRFVPAALASLAPAQRRAVFEVLGTEGSRAVAVAVAAEFAVSMPSGDAASFSGAAPSTVRSRRARAVDDRDSPPADLFGVEQERRPRAAPDDRTADVARLVAELVPAVREPVDAADVALAMCEVLAVAPQHAGSAALVPAVEAALHRLASAAPMDRPGSCSASGDRRVGGAEAAAAGRALRGAAGSVARQPSDPFGGGEVAATPPAPERLWWLAGGDPVRTRLAGVFYLVNVLARLGLPNPDVTGDASGWGLLDRLARYLLAGKDGELDAEDLEDPVWEVLARLAGCGPELPVVVPVVVPDLALPTGRWFADVATSVTELLARHRVGTAALLVPGIVALTRTHLDVVIDIELVDLAARRAGLDTDPGWVPWLGRVVAFHFVDGGLP